MAASAGEQAVARFGVAVELRDFPVIGHILSNDWFQRFAT